MNTEYGPALVHSHESTPLEIHSILKELGIIGNAEEGYELLPDFEKAPISLEKALLLEMLNNVSLGSDKVVGLTLLKEEDFSGDETSLPHGDCLTVRMDGHSTLQSTIPRPVSTDSDDIRLGLAVISGPEDTMTAYTVDLERSTNEIIVQKRTGQELMTPTVNVEESQHSGPPTIEGTTHYSTPSSEELATLSLLIEAVNDRKILQHEYSHLYDDIRAISVRHRSSKNIAIDFPNGSDQDRSQLASIVFYDEESGNTLRCEITRTNIGALQVTINDVPASLEDIMTLTTLVERETRFISPQPYTLAA